jgi:hypothetical protein
MRTTLTLEDSVAIQLKRLAHSRRSSFKDVVNEVLKRGIAEFTAPVKPKPYRTRARHLGTFKGIDPTRLGQLDDEMSDLHRMGRANDPR